MSERTREWARADTLRSMGLHAGAAAAFDRIAADAADAAARGRALVAAAREHELAGGLAPAAERFERAAEQPELVEAAARGAHRARLRLGEHAAAAAALQRLVALPGLPDRDELARELARLRPLAEGQARTTVTFDGPLAPAWTIRDPLALRRDSAAATLDVDTARSSVLAELPVEVTAEHVALAVDFTLELQEYGANLMLELVPEGGGQPVLGLSASASGGGRNLRRVFHCAFGRRLVSPHPGPVETDNAAVRRQTLRADNLRPLSEQVCVHERHGEDPVVDVARDRRAPLVVPPGRYRLVLRVQSADGSARLRARLHRLSLTGGRVVAGAAGEDAEQSLARALVEGAYAAARELARAPVAGSPARRAWSIDLALRSGDVATARDGLAALGREAAGDREAADVLVTALRRDPGLYGPVLWSAAPGEFLALFRAAWDIPVAQHIDEPRVPPALLDVLGRADLEALADDPARRELAVTLLTWRALALVRSRRPDDARRDLLRAFELSGTLADPRGIKRRDVAIELAVLAAISGDAAGARAAIAAALAAAVNKTAARDMLRARPELAPLLPEGHASQDM